MTLDRGDEQPLLATSASSSTPQGQIDWGVFAKNSIDFTVDALSRLSKAGVEALTIVAARAMFHQLNIGQLGEQRVLDALSRVQGYSSYNNALWFGFGIKHIVRSLAESREGIACIGICSCLAEEFSTSMSSKITRNLFDLYDPPVELRPSLRQWRALIGACEGVVANTSFSLILSKLSRICASNNGSRLHNGPGLHTSTDAKDIARILKAIFDVSNGKLDKIHVTGDISCAWIAAVAHWLLELEVVVEDQSGNMLYRPGNLRSKVQQDAQIFISLGGPQKTSSALVRKYYSLPSGRYLMDQALLRVPEHDLLSHGRLDWNTCIGDAFGTAVKRLLNEYATHTGACLGSAARLYEHITSNVGRDAQIDSYDSLLSYERSTALGPASNGRTLWLHVRERFQELRDARGLMGAMERAQSLAQHAAVDTLLSSLSSLTTLCACNVCNEAEIGEHLPDKSFCLVQLVYALCTLTRISSCLQFPNGIICPTVTGMMRLFMDHRPARGRPLDHIQNILNLRRFRCEVALPTVRRLLTGRGLLNNKACALATDGLCIYYPTLCELSIDPERMFAIHIVPGKIELEGHLYSAIEDSDADTFGSLAQDSKWPRAQISSISTYNGLNDSSSKSLSAALIIEEREDDRFIEVHWRVTSPNGWWMLKPLELMKSLTNSYIGKTCEANMCGSVNGLKGTLLEGEGVLDELDFREGDVFAIPNPFIRVLSSDPISVMVAISQSHVEAPKYTRHGVFVTSLLQGKQCVRCCVINAMKALSIPREGQSAQVAIITDLTGTGETVEHQEFAGTYG